MGGDTAAASSLSSGSHRRFYQRLRKSAERSYQQRLEVSRETGQAARQNSPLFEIARVLVWLRSRCPLHRKHESQERVTGYHGRGAGVGRGLGVGVHLPVHGVGVGVAVAVGVGVGVPPPGVTTRLSTIKIGP